MFSTFDQHMHMHSRYQTISATHDPRKHHRRWLHFFDAKGWQDLVAPAALQVPLFVCKTRTCDDVLLHGSSHKFTGTCQKRSLTQHLSEASSESFCFTACWVEDTDVDTMRDCSPGLAEAAVSLFTSVLDKDTQFPGVVASFLSAACVLLTRFASVVKVLCAFSISFFSTLLVLASSPFCVFKDIEALRFSLAFLPEDSKVVVTCDLAAVLCRARAECGAISSSEPAIQPKIILCAD
jgi:hypothetical protein